MKELKTDEDMKDVCALWHCPNCDNAVTWSYYDFVVCGGPVCENCDSDMVLEE